MAFSNFFCFFLIVLFCLKHYSKCDNRLFCIKFEIPNKGSYPFLEAFTNQMRCISRTGGDSVTPKRLSPLDEGVPSSNGASDSSLSMKRIKFGEEKIPESEVKSSSFLIYISLFLYRSLLIILYCCFSLS